MSTQDDKRTAYDNNNTISLRTNTLTHTQTISKTKRTTTMRKWHDKGNEEIKKRKTLDVRNSNKKPRASRFPGTRYLATLS